MQSSFWLPLLLFQHAVQMHKIQGFPFRLCCIQGEQLLFQGLLNYMLHVSNHGVCINWRGLMLGARRNRPDIFRLPWFSHPAIFSTI